MRLGPRLDSRQGGRVSLSWPETGWWTGGAQVPGDSLGILWGFPQHPKTCMNTGVCSLEGSLGNPPGEPGQQCGRLFEQGTPSPSALPCTPSALPFTTMPREDLFSGNPLNPENDDLDPYAGLSPREKLARLNQAIGRMDTAEQEARRSLRQGQEQFVRLEQTARRLGIDPLDPVAARAEAEGRSGGGGGGGSSPRVIDVQAQVVEEQRVLPEGTRTTPGERTGRESAGSSGGTGRAGAASNRTRNNAARRRTDSGPDIGKCGGREQPRDSRGRFDTCG